MPLEQALGLVARVDDDRRGRRRRPRDEAVLLDRPDGEAADVHQPLGRLLALAAPVDHQVDVVAERDVEEERQQRRG